MPRIRPLSILTLIILLSTASPAQTLDKNLQAGLKAISPAEACDIVKTLASWADRQGAR